MRLNTHTASPQVAQAVSAVSAALARGPLEASLRCLVEIRASQLNGCSFCLAMHADGAREAGVPQAKLDTIAGWRHESSFTPRERAALALTESLTVLAAEGVPEPVWSDAAASFDEEELATLLYLIGIINLYNRVNVAVERPADDWYEHGWAGLRAPTGPQRATANPAH